MNERVYFRKQDPYKLTDKHESNT